MERREVLGERRLVSRAGSGGFGYIYREEREKRDMIMRVYTVVCPRRVVFALFAYTADEDAPGSHGSRERA